MGIKINLDANAIARKVQEAAMKKAATVPISFDCPACSARISHVAGRFPCPKCGEQIHLELRDNNIHADVVKAVQKLNR